MRARTLVILSLFLFAILLPLAPVASAELDELGAAGVVDEMPGRALDWWVLQNGNILYANASAVVSVWNTSGGVYTEMITIDANVPSASVAIYDPVANVVALGHGTGVEVVSLDYEDVLYSINSGTGGSVEALVFDAEGDIWITQRNYKTSSEWTLSSATGAETSPHSGLITGVAVTNSGQIATSGRNKDVRIHEHDGSHNQTLTNSQYPVVGLATNADGSILYSMTDNCKMLMHNTSDWIFLGTITMCSSGMVRSIDLIGEERLMVGTVSGRAFSIELATHTLSQEYFDVTGEVVGFIPSDGDGVLVLTAFNSVSYISLLDTDNDDDGVVDGLDAFPNDPTQHTDSDGDGYGDNMGGNNSDAFPSDSTQWLDSDGDGRGDNPSGNNADAFPFNSDQYADSDGDGYGDYPHGQDGDKFPSDPTQWADSDWDGYGDNQDPGATDSDACPSQGGDSTEDRLGCQDTDGDGWSDPGNGEDAHPSGNADAFPNEVTQWRDTDGDGYGDNINGYRGDACAALPGVSTRAVLYDATEGRYSWIYRYGCIDSDGDGYDDTTESSYGQCTFVGNSTEWIDHDRDCVGANTDYNDTDPSVKTLEDHCGILLNQNQSACSYLRAEGPVDGNTSEVDDTDDKEWQLANAYESAKEFGLIAILMIVVIVVALLMLVGVMKLIGKASKSRKPDAQYTHQDATKELDAQEAGEKFESRGGVINQKGWEDEPLAEQESVEDDDEVVDSDEDMPIEVVDPDYGAGEDIDEMAGTTQVAEVHVLGEADMTVAELKAALKARGLKVSGKKAELIERLNSDSQPVVEAAAPEPSPQPDAQTAPSEAPSEAPPLPAGGLPEGWTMDQWRWYGHQWLERHGDS